MLQVCGKLLNLFCATILLNTFFKCKKGPPKKVMRWHWQGKMSAGSVRGV